MSDHCETVSAALGLYAEGELHDPRAVELVREHLLDCVDCREALDSYDRLTSTLLAGEPERLPDSRADLERERRVEGVLRRLEFTAARPAVTGEGAAGRSRVSDGPGPAAAVGRSARPRLRLHLDDVTPGATTDRRPPRAPGSRMSAAAAAALLGAVSVWLALMLSRHAPEPAGQASLDQPERPSQVLIASSGPGVPASESSPRESDPELVWVVDPAESEVRSVAASAGTNVRQTARTLYGVDFGHAPGSSFGAFLPEELEIQWLVEVDVSSTPPDQDLSKARYLLVPQPQPVTDLVDASGSAAALWIRPRRVARSPVRETFVRRLTIKSATVYQVYVYEGIRRLELPDPGWAPLPWHPTFTRDPAERAAPRPLSFTAGPLRPDALAQPSLRF